jgi:hypothetical protein
MTTYSGENFRSLSTQTEVSFVCYASPSNNLGEYTVGLSGDSSVLFNIRNGKIYDEQSRAVGGCRGGEKPVKIECQANLTKYDLFIDDVCVALYQDKTSGTFDSFVVNSEVGKSIDIDLYLSGMKPPTTFFGDGTFSGSGDLFSGWIANSDSEIEWKIFDVSIESNSNEFSVSGWTSGNLVETGILYFFSNLDQPTLTGSLPVKITTNFGTLNESLVLNNVFDNDPNDFLDIFDETQTTVNKGGFVDYDVISFHKDSSPRDLRVILEYVTGGQTGFDSGSLVTEVGSGDITFSLSGSITGCGSLSDTFSGIVPVIGNTISGEITGEYSISKQYCATGIVSGDVVVPINFSQSFPDDYYLCNTLMYNNFNFSGSGTVSVTGIVGSGDNGILCRTGIYNEEITSGNKRMFWQNMSGTPYYDYYDKIEFNVLGNNNKLVGGYMTVDFITSTSYSQFTDATPNLILSTNAGARSVTGYISSPYEQGYCTGSIEYGPSGEFVSYTPPPYAFSGYLYRYRIDFPGFEDLTFDRVWKFEIDDERYYDTGSMSEVGDIATGAYVAVRIRSSNITTGVSLSGYSTGFYSGCVSAVQTFSETIESGVTGLISEGFEGLGPLFSDFSGLFSLETGKVPSEYKNYSTFGWIESGNYDNRSFLPNGSSPLIPDFIENHKIRISCSNVTGVTDSGVALLTVTDGIQEKQLLITGVFNT